MAGTRSCTWLCSVFKVYCRGKGTQAEEAPLLLLPRLDYGCSRCKCVSEPLTNTNAGIKGQQQQSRRARTRTHAHTRALALSRTHIHTLSLSHTRARELSRAHCRHALASEELAPESSVRTRCPRSFQGVLLKRKCARRWRKGVGGGGGGGGGRGGLI